ncbi:N-acetylgalactosamine kinase [Plakobranchus ocellatus]|uniref:N-acetylgalactosamine kinase n=1 Tax=Plakobranchus ocellatus TaxID=259542 RepID=A0AAV4A483_9GAST|nr:N-acetylgalactosamine kinase [Plakobranchus ocellatus]
MASENFCQIPIPDNRKERCEQLRQKFLNKFGEEPAFFARAPGRVNLIGEHVDYCGYSVLPMAIEQDILMAVSPDDSGKLSFVNVDPNYDDFTGDVMQIRITKDDPQWYKYMLCGVLGVKENFCSLIVQGFKAVVSGTIPPSAGLSSSSALVCCAALAMLQANSWPMSKEKLCEICASCEHYIGTEGGGMDQAISLTASPGKAKHIEFNPLRTTDVQLPKNVAFVVSNSLAQMNKAATPYFNIRVVECRIAAQILAKSRPSLQWREIKRLGEVQSRLGFSLDAMLGLVESTLHKEPYSKAEVCKLLGISPEELAETSLSTNTRDVESFLLYQRATHVYSEAKRVLAFKSVCDSQPPDALEQLGRLMDESHASCRDMYECSHPDLDTLVELCKKNGAQGSRMTGAGWGGCAVSIVHSDRVDTLLAGVREQYYSASSDRAGKVASALFATVPGGGAAYYSV